MNEHSSSDLVRTFETHGLRVIAHEHLRHAVVTDRLIQPGETIAIWRGRVISAVEAETLSPEEQEQLLQVGKESFLYTDVNGRCTVDFINHSCDPNCGFADATTLVSMRRIEPGEAITFDYAMSDCNSFVSFDCNCRSTRCRGRLTRDDWRLHDLQARYAGWFAPHVAALINAAG